jgi:hypothetical protein
MSAIVLAVGTASYQDSAPESESVIVEGVGSTEFAAKKMAYQEAVRKVVGVLIDSKIQVKNDKIIREELLEFSGGFVKKVEVLSSQKEKDGLVRVKVKCLVEKAQVISKLEDLNVKVVNVDGTNLAAKEMTLEKMREEGTAMLSKALKERQLVFTTIPPKSLDDLKKAPDGSFYIPVRLAYDADKVKAWTKKWVPIFEKMAIKTGSFRSTGDSKLLAFYFQEIDYDPKKVDITRSIFINIPQFVSDDFEIKWRWFSIPCDVSQLSLLNTCPNLSTLEPFEPKIIAVSKIKVCLDIVDKDCDPLYQSESSAFGLLVSKSRVPPTEYKLPIVGSDEYNLLSEVSVVAAINYGSVLEFPPFQSIKSYICDNPVGDNSRFSFHPDHFGCVFKAKISAENIAKISKIITKIQWVDPKKD